jgi:hypothetical protein
LLDGDALTRCASRSTIRGAMRYSRTMRRRIRSLALIAAGLVVGSLLVELAFRIFKPFPPVQVVRTGLRVEDGAPMWGDDARSNRQCAEQHPDRLRILFFGSSITWGSGVENDQTFAVELEQRLNTRFPNPGFCVLNFAYPGFGFQQKFVAARHEIPRYRPALVMWEGWAEWRDYHVMGDVAYNAQGLARGQDGYFVMPVVPSVLNRILFRNSRTYEYLTLTFGERETGRQPNEVEATQQFIDAKLSRAVTLTRDNGGRFVLFLAVPLDQPFDETAAHPPANRRVYADYGHAHDFTVVPLERELVGQDYLALRYDPCCHFSAAGHQAVSAILERVIVDELAARLTAGGPRSAGP